MKDWHNLIVVYLAGRKTPATPENIKQYLKKHGISKSHTAITTACKESLSDVLSRHDHSTYNDDGTLKQPRFKYSLKDGVSTLHLLVKSPRHPSTENTFLGSPYYHGWIPKLVQQFDDLMPLHVYHASKRWAKDYEGSYDIKDSAYYLSETYNHKINQNSIICCVIEFCGSRAKVTFDVDGRSDEDLEILKRYLIKYGLQLDDDEVFKDTTEKPVDHMARIKYTTNPQTVSDEIITIVKNHLPDEDKQCLAASLGANWLTLKFVLHFIAAEHDERDMILDQVNRDANDPHISPWAAGKDSFGAALKLVEYTCADVENLKPIYLKLKEERQSEPLTPWVELFNQLDRINSNYRFLFD